MSTIKRDNTYYLRRRIPRRFARVEPRGTIWISLHTDSPAVAQSKADRTWSQMIEAWEARLAGETDDAEALYSAAQNLARVRGFRYIDVGTVVDLPVEQVIERVETIAAPAARPDNSEAAALLGTIPKPGISVSKALDLYWTLAREKTLGKSADQLRRWRNPRKKAIRNFITV
ncbi:MAG: DUF6538 domain-containing protein, partial [Pseudomonadota bacterium]